MKITTLLGAAFLSALTLGSAFAAKETARHGVNVGSLSCEIESGVGLVLGSNKDVNCVYRSPNGKAQRYTGTMTHIGLDIGVTSDGRIIWAVFAPGNLKPGALAGTYFGASAEATVGIGGGVNALVGGFNHAISLQPVSVQANSGLNAALAVSQLKLKAVK